MFQKKNRKIKKTMFAVQIFCPKFQTKTTKMHSFPCKAYLLHYFSALNKISYIK